MNPDLILMAHLQKGIGVMGKKGIVGRMLANPMGNLRELSKAYSPLTESLGGSQRAQTIHQIREGPCANISRKLGEGKFSPFWGAGSEPQSSAVNTAG